MKTLMKKVAALILCLSLAGLTANAVTISYTCSASNGSSDSTGGSPTVPMGGCVQWYVYSYGPASSYVSVGGVVQIYESSPSNGSRDGYQHAMTSGGLSVYVSAQSYSGGSAGSGVNVSW